MHREELTLQRTRRDEDGKRMQSEYEEVVAKLSEVGGYREREVERKLADAGQIRESGVEGCVGVGVCMNA